MVLHPDEVEALRAQLDDFAAEVGEERATKTLQFILRVPQTGILDVATRTALALRDSRIVNNMLVGAREVCYYQLAQERAEEKELLKDRLTRARKFLIT